MLLSVIMPAYNERETIAAIVERVMAVDLAPHTLELVIVDDGSRDGTRDVLSAYAGTDRMCVFLQERNGG